MLYFENIHSISGEFNIGGLTFHWFPEGIFGIALTPPDLDGFKNLLFQPIASNSAFSVSTRILRNKTLAESADSYNRYVKIGERGPNGHLTAHVMDHNGILFFNLVDRNAVGCWNSRNPYKPEYIGHVDVDDEALIFPSDVKIVGDDLWVISDRMPIQLESDNGLDFNDVNFRIFTVPIKTAIQGTVCDGPLIESISYQKPALYPAPAYIDTNALYPTQQYIPYIGPQATPKNFLKKKIFVRPELPSYQTEAPFTSFIDNNQLAPVSNPNQNVPAYNPNPNAPSYIPNPNVPSYNPSSKASAAYRPAGQAYSYNKFYYR